MRVPILFYLTQIDFENSTHYRKKSKKGLKSHIKNSMFWANWAHSQPSPTRSDSAESLPNETYQFTTIIILLYF